MGDAHERWSNAADGAALRALAPDHVIFVGDLGNRENPDLVAEIAALDLPKSVILGNHDAWTQLGARRPGAGPNREIVTAAPADALLAHGLRGEGGGGGGNPVLRQLELLGDAHLGYREAPLPGRGVTLVGGRPFSKVGPRCPARGAQGC